MYRNHMHASVLYNYIYIHIINIAYIHTTEDVEHYNLFVEGAFLSGVKESTQDVVVCYYGNRYYSNQCT